MKELPSEGCLLHHPVFDVDVLVHQRPEAVDRLVQPHLYHGSHVGHPLFQPHRDAHILEGSVEVVHRLVHRRLELVDSSVADLLVVEHDGEGVVCVPHHLAHYNFGGVLDVVPHGQHHLVGRVAPWAGKNQQRQQQDWTDQTVEGHQLQQAQWERLFKTREIAQYSLE